MQTKFGKVVAALCLSLAPLSLRAEVLPLDQAVQLFGARAQIGKVSLAPDGSKIAYIAAVNDKDTAVMVRGVADDAKPVGVLATSGGDSRLIDCRWVSVTRLVCTAYATTVVADRVVPATRVLAVDADGRNLKQLSLRSSVYSRGFDLSGGGIIDWLPDANGAVLMERSHIADDRIESRIGSDQTGLAVDRVDTRTLASTPVEAPHAEASMYLTDGHGTVRVMGTELVTTNAIDTGQMRYSYRRPGSREWEKLSTVDQAGAGFTPLAVDREQNLVFGLAQADGRQALFSRSLDGRLEQKLVLARPDVDVDGVVQLGRRGRVVGATFETEARQISYFDNGIAGLMSALGRAIPKQPEVDVVDASLDEHKLLVFAGSDDDPGVFYLFDRDKRDLHILFPARPPLEGHPLATMRPTHYRAGDGTMVPAYLTLPPGRSDMKGLPAIVMPHGGPTSRDRWGFDWLPQFYASQGYAVLQPEYRGSSGYGDQWLQRNGFQSWRAAIGDVTDAGRWLVAQGADPARLAIVGWSYGGYAALQSAVVAPSLFKAVVAVAPVTDLVMLKGESAGWTDDMIRASEIGAGSDLRQASPAQNAGRIKVPVLLAHGTRDANVSYQESVLMENRLRAAGGKVQLITFRGLDHQLDSDSARQQLLSESITFLQQAFAK